MADRGEVKQVNQRVLDIPGRGNRMGKDSWVRTWKEGCGNANGCFIQFSLAFPGEK